MSVVIATCPLSGKDVATGISMDRETFRSLLPTQYYFFRCWRCGNRHGWENRSATLLDENDPALIHLRPPDASG
jgi:hypothetical protein